MNRCDVTPRQLLPHRKDMLLIDRILEVDREKAVTKAVVGRHWPLIAGDAVSTLVAVELIAQTAGICNGWINLQRHGDDFSRRGWLVGVKRAFFHAPLIPLQAAVVTTARNGYKFESFREVSGTVRLEAQVFAQVTLQLFQPVVRSRKKPAQGDY